MRTYKTIEPRANSLPNLERTYSGFDRNLNRAEFIVNVFVQGETEFYAIDNPATDLKTLKEYLIAKDEGGSIISLYKNLRDY